MPNYFTGRAEHAAPRVGVTVWQSQAGEGAWGLTGGGGGIGHALAEKMVSRAGRAAAKIRQPGCSLGCGLQQPGEGTQLPGRVCWRMQLATAT